jgi:hypothetical protein
MSEDEPDSEIGKTIGLQTDDDCFHIGVITDIDDATERVTVRTEEGREVIGTLNGVFLDPERRMSEIMKHMKREKTAYYAENQPRIGPQSPTLNWAMSRESPPESSALEPPSLW